MSAIITRRAILKSITASALAAPISLATSIDPADADNVSAVNYMVTGRPLLGVVEIIETQRAGAAQRELVTRLQNISDDLVKIASKQDEILKALSEQRLIVREEVQQAFLNNDVREQLALAQYLQTKTRSNNLDTSKEDLGQAVMRIDILAFKIPTYGLMAVPDYLALIAQQNAAHILLNSPNKDFLNINDAHRNNLVEMRYGRGSESLSGLLERLHFPDLSKRQSTDAPVTEKNQPGFFGSAYDKLFGSSRPQQKEANGAQDSLEIFYNMRTLLSEGEDYVERILDAKKNNG